MDSLRDATLVHDRHGRPLHVGDTVILLGTPPPEFVVTAIVPALEPGMPPRALKVTLRTQAMLLVPMGQAQEAIVLTVPAPEPAAPTNGDH